MSDIVNQHLDDDYDEAEYEAAYNEALDIETEDLADRITDAIMKGRSILRKAKAAEGLALTGEAMSRSPNIAHNVGGAMMTTAATAAIKNARQDYDDLYESVLREADVQGIDPWTCPPEVKDFDRIEGLNWQGSTFHGDNSAFEGNITKMVKVIKDPKKLVRRTLAALASDTHVKGKDNKVRMSPGDKTSMSPAWFDTCKYVSSYFISALKNMGFSPDQIKSVYKFGEAIQDGISKAGGAYNSADRARIAHEVCDSAVLNESMTDVYEEEARVARRNWLRQGGNPKKSDEWYAKMEAAKAKIAALKSSGSEDETFEGIYDQFGRDNAIGGGDAGDEFEDLSQPRSMGSDTRNGIQHGKRPAGAFEYRESNNSRRKASLREGATTDTSNRVLALLEERFGALEGQDRSELAGDVYDFIQSVKGLYWG